MFDSYEYQQSSSMASTCDIESMDDIPPPPTSSSSILSLNDDLTPMQTQNSVVLRFVTLYATINDLKFVFYLFRRQNVFLIFLL